MIRAVIFDFFGVLEEDLFPNRPLLGYIKTNLKPKYKLGIISNAEADWLYDILSASDVKLFDDIVLSHRAGVAKPEPAIYEQSLRNLGVRGSETVFVDDIDRFCVAAQALGMRTVVYQSFPQMKKDLEAVLARAED